MPSYEPSFNALPLFSKQLVCLSMLSFHALACLQCSVCQENNILKKANLVKNELKQYSYAGVLFVTVSQIFELYDIFVHHNNI